MNLSLLLRENALAHLALRGQRETTGIPDIHYISTEVSKVRMDALFLAFFDGEATQRGCKASWKQGGEEI